MSIFSKIKNKFGKGRYREISDLDSLTKLPPIPIKEKEHSNQQELQEEIHLENVKAKLDLVLTKLDSIKTQNQMMDERIKNMEKTLADMRGIKYY